MNSSTVSGKYINCTYLHIHIIYILYTYYTYYINPSKYQFNPSKYQSIQFNPSNSIHQYPNQFKPNQFNPSISNIQYPNQIPCGRYIHDINHILTLSIDILFHQISIHQFNSIQSKYQFIQQFQLLNNQHV